LILPTHRLLDEAFEKNKGINKIGTTGKGIGPAYSDKISRNGLRVGDILNNFQEKYNILKQKHLDILKSLDFDFDISELEATWLEGVEYLKKFTLINSDYYINQLLMKNKTILAESAQGTMLDIDFGSYPYVTSSNTICAGCCTGLGISRRNIGDVYGIFKAYCTRVGSGPFPTELFDEKGEIMCKKGNEYGSVTGRQRRCGWLDLVALKYSIMLNGVTKLIMMKSDVLSDFDTIKVAVAYNIDGLIVEEFPFEYTDNIEVIYTELQGWNNDLTKVTSENEFPEELNNYIQFLENELNLPIVIVSVGPDRKQTVIRDSF
jgi:adenylosuccinate synthase